MKDHCGLCFPSPIALALAIALTSAPGNAQNGPAAAAGPRDPFAVLAAKQPDPAITAGTRIVVHGPDGAPAPDAIVVFAPSGDEAARTAWRDSEQRACAAFPTDLPRRLALQHAGSVRYDVDAAGSTRVPKDGHVLAFVGEQLACRSLAAARNEPQVTLRLGQPPGITVEVTAADGTAAAGVPVVLWRPQDIAPTPLAATGADGSLAMRLLPDDAAAARIGLDVVAHVGLDAPLPANGDRLRLRLPVTTRITARFEGDMADGTELAFGLQAAGGSHRVAGQRLGPRSASWPFVEVGCAATATVWSEQLAIATDRIDVPPDPAPVVLTRTKAPPTLAMPILDSDGKPAADRMVAVVWLDGNLCCRPVRTNRAGWLELHVPAHLCGRPSTPLKVSLLGGPSGEQLLATGELEVTVLTEPWTRTPPVRCKLLPLVAGGVLVTADGQPVRNFDLQVFQEGWQGLRTDDEGRFEIRNLSTVVDATIVLPRTWCFVAGQPWAAPVLRGTFERQLVVQRSARVRFASDLEGPIDSWLRWRLQRTDGQGAPLEMPFSPADRELLVPPGTWNFTLLGERKDELLYVADVYCASGVETHEARFLQFDWRQLAILVELSVRDVSGAPTDACTVWVHTACSKRVASARGGKVRLLLPLAGADLEVQPHDQRLPRLRLQQVTTDQTVVLGGGPPLTVQLWPTPQLPPGLELLLALDDGAAVPLGDDDAATVMAPTSGRVEPKVFVRWGDSRIGPLEWQLPKIDVPTGAASTVLEVTPTRQLELTKAMRTVWKL